MTKVINLFAGPGTGKSTTAADLFALMKWGKFNVELIDEFAKKVVWEGHHNLLQDQLYISAKQNRKLQRLIGQVDYIITDSPLIMCYPYVCADYPPSFKPFIKELFDQYDNLNIFLRRKKDYVALGRGQTEAEARQLDDEILDLLDTHDYDYHIIDADQEAKHNILQLINPMYNTDYDIHKNH